MQSGAVWTRSYQGEAEGRAWGAAKRLAKGLLVTAAVVFASTMVFSLAMPALVPVGLLLPPLLLAWGRRS